jgi:hypothetical protein
MSLGDIEIRSLEQINGRLEIEKTSPSRRSQHTERTDKMQMPPLRLLPATHVVDNQFVGVKFLRQENRIAFALVKVSLHEFRTRFLAGNPDLQPSGRPGDPTTHDFQSVWS